MATTIITNPDLFNLESLNTALQLPSGTTAERPTSPSTGEWRYNTTTNLIEFYDGAAWRDLLSEDIPVIPSENFNTVLYTGNGTSQSITGVGFKPDWIWIKERTSTSNNVTFDSTRGIYEQLYITTDAQSNNTATVSSFDSDGFSVGNGLAVNESGQDYVAWCWKAKGGTTSSNTDGTITSTVQANTKAGFSIIKFTGTGANATVGHGLNSTPEIYFMKNLDQAGYKWPTHTQDAGSLSGNNTGALNETSSFSSYTPTADATTIGLTSGQADRNPSGQEMIVYAFHSVAGYSKVGTYTGNASTNGPIINTGFEPAFLMVKNTSIGTAGSYWAIYDNKRTPSNPRDTILRANDSSGDFDSDSLDINFLTNGFQVKGTYDAVNGNGNTFVYIAFAATPSTAPVLADSFNPLQYSGNGGTQSITGVGFSPNFLWIKQINGSEQHYLYDTIRGSSKYLHSNLTSGEGTDATTRLTSFDSNGFSVASDGSVNGSGSNYISWNWKANPLPAINTDGTIQSIVSANQAAGFSIVQWTGAGGSSAQTVGHGLSAAPELIIVKKTSGTQDWYVFSVYANSGTDPANYFIKLNSSDAETLNTGSPPSIFAGTAPTASVFSVGSTLQESATYIAYCFHSVSGFSKFGTYTGNGSTQSITGVGFQPNWLMIKQTNASNSWRVFDSARGLSAPQTLFANLSNAEDSESNTVSSFDSDGWTMGSQQGVNDNGDTYLYVAFKANLTP